MRKWTVLGIVVATIGLLVLSQSTARADGPPAGQGANGCYLLYGGGTLADATPLVLDATYNVGNPASVLVAGDCSGGPISFVDDGLGVTLSNPTGGGGNLHQDFFNFCGGANNGGPALNVTSLFKPGTNTLSLTLTNECGGTVFAPALYLVVTQR
jgi:hypothetical protein